MSASAPPVAINIPHPKQSTGGSKDMTASSSPSPVGSPIVPPVFHSFEPPSIPSIASSSTLPSTISPPTIPAAPIPRRLTHVSVRAALRELAKEQPKSSNEGPLSFHSSSDDEDAEEEEDDELDDYDDDDDEMPSPRSRMRDLSPSRSGLSPSPSASPSPSPSMQRSSSPCTRRHRHGTGLRHRTHLSDVVAWHHLSFQYALAYGVAPDGLHLEPIAIYDKTFREPQWKTSSSWKEKIAVGILTKEGIHAKHIATSVRTAHSVVDLLSYIFNVKAHPGLETVLLAENFFSNPKHGFIFREGSERLQQEGSPKLVHFFDIAWLHMQVHRPIREFFAKHISNELRHIIFQETTSDAQIDIKEMVRLASQPTYTINGVQPTRDIQMPSTTIEQGSSEGAPDASPQSPSSSSPSNLHSIVSASIDPSPDELSPSPEHPQPSPSSIGAPASAPPAPVSSPSIPSSCPNRLAPNAPRSAKGAIPLDIHKFLAGLIFVKRYNRAHKKYHYELHLSRARPVKVIDLRYPESSLNLATWRAVSTNVLKGGLSAIPFFGPGQIVNMALERVFDFTDVLHLQHQAEAMNLIIEFILGCQHSPFDHPDLTTEMLQKSVFYLLRSNIMLSSIIKNTLIKKDELVPKYIEQLAKKREESLQYLIRRQGTNKLDVIPIPSTFFALGVQRHPKSGTIIKLKLYVLVFTKIGRSKKPHAAVDFVDNKREMRKREFLQQILTVSNMLYVPVPGVGGIVKMAYKEVIIREVHKRQMWEHALLAHIKHHKGQLASIISEKVGVDLSIARRYEAYAIKQLEERALSPLDLTEAEADVHRKNVEAWISENYPSVEEWTSTTRIPQQSLLSRSGDIETSASPSVESMSLSNLSLSPQPPVRRSSLHRSSLSLPAAALRLATIPSPSNRESNSVSSDSDPSQIDSGKPLLSDRTIRYRSNESGPSQASLTQMTMTLATPNGDTRLLNNDHLHNDYADFATSDEDQEEHKHQN